jgi:hypothetical protein
LTVGNGYGRAALRHELERLSQAVPGTRNDSLNRASFALGQLVAASALDKDEATAALTAEGQRLGLGLREVERTVASGMTAEMQRPRGLADRHFRSCS